MTTSMAPWGRTTAATAVIAGALLAAGVNLAAPAAALCGVLVSGSPVCHHDVPMTALTPATVAPSALTPATRSGTNCDVVVDGRVGCRPS